ncbi:uncharacterized protein BDR25DRAFT_362692 [Lindgomyces ingoldianus]|uniref:Uncharacterized protein n=1 Tax=Lindgomyces ingoldianus TaxID=673940 RepID=A0ACB6QBN5_9PLEO|nr:uncharacterized protein BDR25DRAFT_362692 [Lindgomyces ingoldianus]KAF2463522.1 hypothetical protein BDR25DRAFT_362692 [Lindgomyces ingoldianus]
MDQRIAASGVMYLENNPTGVLSNACLLCRHPSPLFTKPRHHRTDFLNGQLETPTLNSVQGPSLSYETEHDPGQRCRGCLKLGCKRANSTFGQICHRKDELASIYQTTFENRRIYSPKHIPFHCQAVGSAYRAISRKETSPTSAFALEDHVTVQVSSLRAQGPGYGFSHHGWLVASFPMLPGNPLSPVAYENSEVKSWSPHTPSIDAFFRHAIWSRLGAAEVVGKKKPVTMPSFMLLTPEKACLDYLTCSIFTRLSTHFLIYATKP